MLYIHEPIIKPTVVYQFLISIKSSGLLSSIYDTLYPNSLEILFKEFKELKLAFFCCVLRLFIIDSINMIFRIKSSIEKRS